MDKKSLINMEYDDCYFSIEDGYLESEYVFIKGNNLLERIEGSFNIGETGFGTGLNLLVLEDNLLSLDLNDIDLTFTSIEKFILEPLVVNNTLNDLKEVTNAALSRHVTLYEKIFSEIKPGWNNFTFKRVWGRLKINLFYGDVMDSFKSYPLVNNAWFLDGHSPDKNPDMWSENLFSEVSKNSQKGTTFATFTAAGIVKRGLRNAGFFVKRKKGFGKKRHMILGAL